MIRWIAVLFISTLSTTALAQSFEQTICQRRNCLQYGYTVINEQSEIIRQVRCDDPIVGCESGFTITDEESGSVYQAQCLSEGGCFTDGYNIISQDSGKKVQKVTCIHGDCLTNGYVTMSKVTLRDIFRMFRLSKKERRDFLQRIVTYTLCEDNSCEFNGWSTYLSLRDIKRENPSSQTTCQGLSCFASGYIEEFAD